MFCLFNSNARVSKPRSATSRDFREHLWNSLTSLGYVPPGQHPVRLQSTKFKYRNTHYKNSEKIQLFYIGLKINVLWVTQVRNRDKTNHLPLKIFIVCTQKIFNKRSFCSLKSLFISENLSFVCAFSSVIHRLKRSHNRQTEKSKLYLSYSAPCILMREISIWPLCKTWLRTWWQNLCW